MEVPEMADKDPPCVGGPRDGDTMPIPVGVGSPDEVEFVERPSHAGEYHLVKRKGQWLWLWKPTPDFQGLA
jgi:hypothetical protein